MNCIPSNAFPLLQMNGRRGLIRINGTLDKSVLPLTAFVQYISGKASQENIPFRLRKHTAKSPKCASWPAMQQTQRHRRTVLSSFLRGKNQKKRTLYKAILHKKTLYFSILTSAQQEVAKVSTISAER